MAGGKIEGRVVVIIVLTILVALRIKCLVPLFCGSMQMKIFKPGCGSSIGAAE